MATQAIGDAKIDIGRVIQRGFQTLSRRLPVFAIIALVLTAIPAIILGLVLVPVAISAANPTDPTAALAVFASPAFWLTILVAVICSVLLQAAIVRASILDLRGQSVDIASNLVEALKLALPMIGLAILTTLAVGIASILLIIPGIIVFLMLIVAPPVLISERRGVIESMRRSSELTKGSRWRIFLLCVIYLVISWVFSLIIALVVAPLTVASPVLGLIVQSILSAIVNLIGAVMVASLYVELRMVREGVSEEGLAAIFQ